MEFEEIERVLSCEFQLIDTFDRLRIETAAESWSSTCCVYVTASPIRKATIELEERIATSKALRRSRQSLLAATGTSTGRMSSSVFELLLVRV